MNHHIDNRLMLIQKNEDFVVYWGLSLVRGGKNDISINVF